jgi:hypothetical protein
MHYCFYLQNSEKLSKDLLKAQMPARSQSSKSSGEYFYPIQDRETQKAAMSSTHFQIRSEARDTYMGVISRFS